MSGMMVVKRYARALFEAARDMGVLEEVRSDMEFITSLMEETPEIRRYCLTPHTNRQKEQTFARTAFLPYVSKTTGRMLEILCENGRIQALPFLPEAFQEIEDRDAGITPLLIESVQELSPDILKRIEENMRQRINGNIRSRLSITPSLLGGVRLTWNNRALDMSLRGRLRKMKTLLK